MYFLAIVRYSRASFGSHNTIVCPTDKLVVSTMYASKWKAGPLCSAHPGFISPVLGALSWREKNLINVFVTDKDLGHIWLGCMGHLALLGHLEMSAHLINFGKL